MAADRPPPGPGRHRHRRRRAVGGPAIRNMATVGGNLFAPAPYGDFAVALLALDATVHTTAGRSRHRRVPAGRDRACDAIVAAVSFAAAGSRSIPLRESVARQAEGRFGAEHRGRHRRRCAGTGNERADRAWLHGRPADPRQGRREGAGRCNADGGRHCAGGGRGRGGHRSRSPTPIASAWYRSEVLPVHFRRLLLE